MNNKFDAIIIGSGFGGIAAAVNLGKIGVSDYLMLERDEELGGTWWRNSYPGAAVDVQSHLYSLSFEPYDWSRMFAKQQEILDYTNHLLDKYNIRSNALTNVNVTEVRYNDDSCKWTVSTDDGRSFEATYVINASGGLSQPNYPTFRGMDTFSGKVMHTSRWDHDYDYRDKRVVVIGSGASAIQVVPAIAPFVWELFLFQRTPPWILPRPDRALTNVERNMFKRFPAVRKSFRNMLYSQLESRVLAFKYPNQIVKFFQGEAINHIKAQVGDPEIQKAVTPSYMMGCKRILISNDYYPSLNRSNVHLIYGERGLKEVNRTGVMTTDGEQIDADLIVYATGFHASEDVVVYPVIGRNGQTLDDSWKDGAHAYLGATVPDFPNFFLIAGPNTGTGHTSALWFIESQIEYITRAIKAAREKNWKSIEVREDVERKYNEGMQKALSTMVWQVGGCNSWYKTHDGRNTTMYPYFSFKFRNDCKNFNPKDHVIRS